MRIKNKIILKVAALLLFFALVGTFFFLPDLLTKAEAATVDVFWLDLNNTSVSGTTIRKIDATDPSWDAGGASYQTFTGNGYVEVKIDSVSAGGSRMLGLNSDYGNSNYQDLEYALYFRDDKKLFAYQKGVLIATLGDYTEGDVFRVAIESNLAKYYKNGALIRTSTTPPKFPLFAQASFYHQGGSFTGVKLIGTNSVLPPFSTPTDPATSAVEWINLVNTSVVTSGTNISVVKTGSAAKNWDASATSKQIIPSGNGYAEVTLNDSNIYYRMFGLNHNNTTPSYTDLDYGLYFRGAEGVLWVYENGLTPFYTKNGLQWTYNLGDKFKIAVSNGVARYYKNDVVFYTSAYAPVYPLFVDTTFHSPNGKFTNMRFIDQNKYTVSGNIFIDTNNNGIKDSGESNYSGAVSITSNNGTVTTTSSGTYTISNLSAGTSLTISYPSLPSGYSMTYPLNGPPPSHSVVVGGSCSLNGALGATCSRGNISNLNFGITDIRPWIQSVCADVAFDDGFDNPLPVGKSTIATDATCTNPGVVFVGDGPSSFGKGNVSSTGWIAGGTAYPEVHMPQTSSGIFLSYAYMAARAKQASITPIDIATICSLSNCTLPANLPSGVYKANGDISLNAYTFSSNKNYVFLINGNLYINGDILLTKGNGSSAAFSASGNIFVNSNVGNTTASSTVSNLDGFYSSDKSFIVSSQNSCPDRRLNIAGAVIANAARGGGSFQNNRDLCGSNSQYPTISFSPRLDLLLSAPSFISHQVSVTAEEAP
jgi:hypothetical protein